MENLINKYFANLKNTIDKLKLDEIIDFIDVLTTAKNNGNNIFIMGNGGSASTASHFCCDFNKGASYQKQKGRAAFAGCRAANCRAGSAADGCGTAPAAAADNGNGRLRRGGIRCGNTHDGGRQTGVRAVRVQLFRKAYSISAGSAAALRRDHGRD